ncbi:thiamine pyrophosphate-dependent enzyme [Methanoculleus sp.]|uniref:thiamine pyrophosphate-dependent enzyme n=1 Tax=Methanoculleus sp. TaxID=90427 RepID=UPI002608ECD0|nr:thiamine pyrophosphate-dependent enzyme [Methanoculleus sp.]MDI6866328.1 thiamine pyrophosphate-dependent enzyme [Methanoculleus sp.]
MTPDRSAAGLITPAQNTWCPGCGNFSIQHMMRSAIAEISEEEGVPIERFVLLGGIGCHGKLMDYLNVNSLYTIHGRSVPAATGIRLANPDLRVICHVGDGDIYAEGLDHLIFAAKRNTDITVIVHDNRVYGLTTGQYTPTSPTGFRGRSTPRGVVEHPINPLEVMLAAGATYIARGYTRKTRHLKEIFKEAIMHRGFSFVEVLQICATYSNLTDYYDARVYEIQDGDLNTARFESAIQKIREWDYDRDAPIALGTFYSVERPVYEESFGVPRAGLEERRNRVRRLVEDWR